MALSYRITSPIKRTEAAIVDGSGHISAREDKIRLAQGATTPRASREGGKTAGGEYTEYGYIALNGSERASDSADDLTE